MGNGGFWTRRLSAVLGMWLFPRDLRVSSLVLSVAIVRGEPDGRLLDP